MTHRSVEVPVIARVEGEGALHVAVDDGEITDLRLEIYEPPRFFEAFLQGRHFDEVPDIVPRICGICPVAYQMTAIHGLERLFGVEVAEGTHDLRRLLYCGEWIESHVLHIFLLAAPDFLGFDNAIEMATEHPDLVRTALQIKRVGNDLMAAIGGREIHPVSPRVGGFSKAPRRTRPGPVPPAARVGARADAGDRGLRRLAGRAGVPPAGRDGLDGQRRPSTRSTRAGWPRRAGARGTRSRTSR